MMETGPATLTVFNLAGAPVATLWQGMAERGRHTVVFDAAALPSGVYFYSLGTSQGVQTRKMLLTK
jgi:gamma-glutamylcysteine synthetase